MVSRRPKSLSATSKPRPDAQRNRERILEAAKSAFTQFGVNASLDDVAKQAGVGAGTLYRHFPTRDELVVAVFRSGMEKLAAAERTLAEDLPPIAALRAWMLLFVDHISTKQIIAPALNAIVGDPSKAFEQSYVHVTEAIRALVRRAIESGDVREDLDAMDILRALIGVANVAIGPDWRPSAIRLVDILVQGSRSFDPDREEHSEEGRAKRRASGSRKAAARRSDPGAT